MKKRILALILMITVLLAFIAGCGLFGTNTEKDMQRVIATVGDKKVYQDEIKKYELVNYFMSSGSQIMQEKSLTASEAMEYLLDQLIYYRITVQSAVNYLIKDFDSDVNSKISNYIIANGFTYYEITGQSESYDKDNIGTVNEYKNYNYNKKTIQIKPNMTIKDVLKPADGEPKTSELLMVLLRVYYDKSKIGSEEFEKCFESFQNYYKALKDSEIFSDYLTIGAFNNVWASEKSSLDTLENQLKKDYGIEIVEEETEQEKTTRAVPQKENARTFTLPAPNAAITSYTRREAKTKYDKQIAKNRNGMTYEEFFELQLVAELEQKIAERHQELMIENQPIDAKEFEKRFNRIKDSEEQLFNLSLTNYKTKLESLGEDTFILYNPDSGIYGYVKQILIGVDSEPNLKLSRELKRIQNIEMTRTEYLDQRHSIFSNSLTGIKVKDLRENPDDEVFEGYPLFNANEYPINNFYNDNFKNVFGSQQITSDIFKSTLSSEDLFKKFKQYIFMYNTDPGMFNNKTDYLLTELNSMNANEKYVSEFAKGAREVIKLAYADKKAEKADYFGYYTMVETDYGYHIIVCSDVIVAGKENLDNYQSIVNSIKNKTETTEQKNTAIYKLYMIMRNELGQEVYNDAIEGNINNYYAGKVTFYKSRYKDLLKIS